jgi:hypothetical protein
MVKALLLEHQQMVHQAVERNRWARLAGPRPPRAAWVVGRTIAAARAAVAWPRSRATGGQDAASAGQTRHAT